MIKTLISIDKINELSLYLIIILLISGPALPDIFATFLSIIFVYLTINKKKFNGDIFLFLIPFFLFLIPNIFSKHFPMSFLEQLVNIRYFLFCLFISIYYKLNIKNLIFFLLFLTSLISVDLIFQHIFKFNLLGIDIVPFHNKSRASSLFLDELIAGGYILKLSLPILGYMIFKNYIKTFLFLIVLYQLAISASGERMNFLLYNFGIMIIIYLNREKVNFKLLFSIFLTIIISIITSYFILDGVKHRIKTTLKIFYLDNNIIDQNLNQNTNNIRSQHIDHYIIAWNIFKDYPIFGTGHKTFRIECISREYLIENDSTENKGCATHPHNNYLEMMADMGIFGLVSFLLLISYIYFRSFKAKIHKSSINGFFVTFITITWPLSTNGNFFNNRVAVMNFLIIGILLHFSSKRLPKLKEI